MERDSMVLKMLDSFFKALMSEFIQIYRKTSLIHLGPILLFGNTHLGKVIV